MAVPQSAPKILFGGKTEALELLVTFRLDQEI